VTPTGKLPFETLENTAIGIRDGLRVPLGSLPETWFARTPPARRPHAATKPLLAPHKSQFSTHLTTGLQASEPSDGPGWPLMAPQERGNPALVMERKTSRKGREVGSMISSSLTSLPGAPATRSSHSEYLSFPTSFNPSPNSPSSTIPIQFLLCNTSEANFKLWLASVVHSARFLASCYMRIPINVF
jgi:hypothetical protein